MTKQSENIGPTQRQLRVGELVRRELASILARGDHFEPDLEGVMISVGEVRVSPDLRVAKIFIYPHGGDEGMALSALNRIAPRLRKEVTAAIKVKFSPELRFFLDRSFDYAEATQKIIRDLPKSGGE